MTMALLRSMNLRGLAVIPILVGCSLFGLSDARAQGPDADWRTLETVHFRIHYPEPAEAWARSVAERLESVRQRVAEEVGYSPTEITDVLVSDPIARSNGTAWPLRGWPRMLLWTTPPGPDSVVGHYRDWTETLLIHEDVHLVHLLRPSRRPLEQRFGRLMPAGPVLRKCPRWVAEGYATLLEGRLTGLGRPNGDLRATVLRRWAQRGELPSYGRMNADGEHWYGMSMAYLMGSAYLEWLEERSGPRALPGLWARLSARHPRSFDEAFAGVFGDSPVTLYNRFRAELTFRAMTLERSMESGIHEGELWQDLRWSTGAPAISPTGDRLALVLRSRSGPSQLVVWSTGEAETEEQRWQETRDRILERDPEDVAAIRTRPLPRDPEASLPTRDRAEPYDPRWTLDGKGLLYTRFEPDREGFLRPDLFRWRIEEGRVERVTHGASVREADPAPDGKWAVAVRQRWGASSIVAVDLATGSFESLIPESIDAVFHHPRISPRGDRLAMVVQRGEGWALEVHHLEAGGRRLDGTVEVLPTPPRATVVHPAWSGDGHRLYAAVGENGVIDIRSWCVDCEAGSIEAGAVVARHHGAALSPAPSPRGTELFYLSLESDGLDLRRLPLGPTAGVSDAEVAHLEIQEPQEAPGAASPRSSESPPSSEPLPSRDSLVPAVRPPEPAFHSPSTRSTLGPDRPYGMGRLELLPLLGGALGPSSSRSEVGLRLGDVVGRFEGLALAVVGGDALRGEAVSLAWRGWPVVVELSGARLEERLSNQPTTVPELGTELDGEARGFQLVGRWSWRNRRSGVVLQGGHWEGRWEQRGSTIDQRISFGIIRLGHRRDLGFLELGQRFAGRVDRGRTAGRSWTRWRGGLRLTATRRDGPTLSLAWHRSGSDDVEHPVDRLRLGGQDSSLYPEALRGSRIFAPALAAGSLVGEGLETRRLALRLRRWPVELFFERHRVEGSEGLPGWSDWLDLRGLEARWAWRARPVLRLPAVELRLGVAEILDGPRADEVESWLGLTFRP